MRASTLECMQKLLFQDSHVHLYFRDIGKLEDFENVTSLGNSF